MPETSFETIGTALVNVMADYGFAFVENDKLDAFNTWLKAFLETADIPVNPPNDADLADL